MTCQEVMKQLESMGTAQNRKVYARHGAGENMFGVSFANLEKLRKQIKVDHLLAAQLWATGSNDAQVLATLIADPQAMTDKQAEAWLKDFSNYGLSEMFGRLVAKSPIGQKKAEKWHKSKDEWIASTGWRMIAHLAMEDKQLPDEYFDPYLELIATGIHQQKNRARYEMNGALIAIGLRNEKLEKKALAVAKKIGKVEVDHGET
ncbi:MAG: DNA alkylation repair protein, partial [Blastocatellia bacterium]